MEVSDQEVQEDGALLPRRVGVGEHTAQKRISPNERLGIALEANLTVLVEIIDVCDHAVIENRVEPVAVRSFKVLGNQTVDLFLGIDLRAVQFGHQVMQLVGVSLVGEDRSTIVGFERVLDGVGIVQEIQNEHVVLVGTRPVQPGKCLYRLDAGKGLVTYIVCNSGSS